MPESSRPLPGDVLKLGYAGATEPAYALLTGAAAHGRADSRAGQVTSTRLLLAMVDLGGRTNRAALPDDTAGARAVHDAIKAFPRYAELSRVYKKDELPATLNLRDVALSDGTLSILQDARRSPLTAVKGKDPAILTADALVAALIANEGTNVVSRLTGLGISMAEIRSAVLSELSATTPGDVPDWRRALSRRPLRATERSEVSMDPVVAYMRNDNASSLVDKLGVNAEARAFARVAAARQVPPPLAFGIFGDWGSGKSFFMNLMQKHVEDLASNEAPESDSRLFHSNIVQIRFNAWHFVETSLWASLVHHIFLELDRWVVTRLKPDAKSPLFDKLATARDLTLAAAERLAQRRQQQKEAAEHLAGAQQELALAKTNVGATPRILWTVLRDKLKESLPPKELKRVVGLAADLGIDQVATDATKLKSALDELRTEGVRSKAIITAIWGRLTSGWYLALAFGAIVLVPPAAMYLHDQIAVFASQRDLLKAFTDQISAASIGVAGFLAAATGIVKMAAKGVRGAVNTLDKYHKELDVAIEEQLKYPSDQVKRAQETLAKQSANVAEAQISLGVTTDRLAEAETEYASGTGRGRLLNFVRERIADGQYAKHLGLIAAVRRDFTELSALMEVPGTEVREASDRELKAYKARAEELIAEAEPAGFLTENDIRILRKSAEPASADGVTFERVILFIDDLDRCPPDKVIEVLQAVHLLLTFPLFVVVVGVDARWVRRSLKKHYEKLLDDTPTSTADGVATPRDYLEKIFQVPYWVRPMTDDGSRAVIMGLAANPIESAASKDIVAGQQSTTVPTNASETGVASQATDSNPSESSKGGTSVAASLTDTEVKAGQPDEASVRLAARALTLTNGEQAFMMALAPFVGRTPRRALRFVNVYRVIKASLGPQELRQLVEEGGYRALMTQLAITTGTPDLQKEWFGFINTQADKVSLANAIEHLAAAEWLNASQDSSTLRDAISLFASKSLNVGEDAAGASVSEDQYAVTQVLSEALPRLRYYSELARRYSFGD